MSKYIMKTEQYHQYSQYHQDPRRQVPASNAMHSDNGNYVHFYNDRSNEANAGVTSNDSETLQVQRRKLLRRAANRRSAQLSRARKKAHMEELKMDNRKLQRISDFLESIPDLVMCVDSSGKITYISDNTICSIKLSSSADNGNNNNDNGSDDEPTHINQILTAESVAVLLETIAQLSKESEPGAQNGQKMKGAVREIYYHNASGFPVSGYMRCSKIISHPYEIENPNENQSESAVEGPSLKKNRSRSPTASKNSLNSLADVAIAAAAAAESAAEDSKAFITTSILSKDEDDLVVYPQKVHEDEFICVIRPAATFENNDSLGTGLSKASMVAHDLGHRSHKGHKGDERPRSPSGSTNSNGSFSAHNDNGSSFHHFSSSNGSSSSTSRGDKNSTSSETGSDDNGNS